MESLEILPRAYSGRAWNEDSIYIPLSLFSMCEDIFEARILGFDVYQFITDLPGEIAHLIAYDISDRVEILTANQMLERDDLPELLSGQFQKFDWCKDDIADMQEDLISKDSISFLKNISVFMQNNIQKEGKWCVLGL